MTSNGQVKGK